MIRVLIIGGTGFIGANLTLELSKRGHRIMVVGTRPLPPAMSKQIPDLKVFPVRLSDDDAIADILASERPDLVIHMASTLTPASSGDQFMVERREILTPTIRLVNALAGHTIPLVFLSSGGTIYGSSRNDRLNEDDPCNPISFYGQTKLELESYIRFASRALGLSYLILRPSNPYGPFQPLKSSQGLISVILGKLLHGEPLEVWGNGGTIRDYIHIDDVVRATCDILEKNMWNQTINVGSGVGHSLLEVVRAAERATGRQVPMAFKPSRGVDVDRIVLDVSRLAGLGAWHHRPLDEGIRGYATQLGLTDGE